MMYIDIKSEQSETQPHSHQEEKLHSASENPDEHPFVIELLSYIDLCMKHVLGSESAMEFIDVSKNNLRRKIRDRLRAKEFNENFDMKFHTYCNFCTKIIFFDEVANSKYEYDYVYFTECCNHPVHKLCWTEYLTRTTCFFCNIEIDNGKPQYDLELTLHHTVNRMSIKDKSFVPRNIWFPKFRNSSEKPVISKY